MIYLSPPRWRFLASKLILFGLVASLFSACEKDTLTNDIQLQQEPNVSNTVNTRTSFETDWIQGFQSYLQDLDNGVSTSVSYTLEEATYGLEWLFNYAYADVAMGNNEEYITASFDIPQNNNWIDLYYDINTHVQTNLSTELNLDFMSIEPNLETNKVDVTTIYKLPTSSILEQYPALNEGSITCDNPPFIDEAFVVGYDGQGDNGVWFPCPDSEIPACGGSPAGEEPEITALEAIEDIFNTEIRQAQLTCIEPEVLFISDINTALGVSQILMTNITGECSNLTIAEADEVGAHDCVGANALNCISCFTSELLVSDQVLKYVPEGAEIISIDLYINWIGNSNSPQYYSANITYGTLQCITRSNDDNPLDIVICC